MSWGLIFGIGINIFIIGVVAWVGGTFYKSFSKTSGTMFERIWAAAQDSATILWAQIIILATGLVTGLAAIADAVDPSLAEQIKANIPPKYVAGFVMFTMIVTIAARLRTLGK